MTIHVKRHVSSSKGQLALGLINSLSDSSIPLLKYAGGVVLPNPDETRVLPATKDEQARPIATGSGPVVAQLL
jgi:hypothetical protein